MRSSSLPISLLPQIRERLDSAERILKADISRLKNLLADPTATPSLSVAESTLREAKNSLELLAVDSRQLTDWQQDTISDADRIEVVRLRAMIPELRPLMQRLIALATELDKRTRTGTASPRKKWRH